MARVTTDRRRVKPSRRPTQREDTYSGDVSVPLVSLGAGTRVSSASARVSGATFHGRIRDLAGARVTESKVVYSAGVAGLPKSGESAFIIDFHGSRSVLAVSMTDDSPVTLLLPWLGTDFSSQAAWSSGAGAATVDLTGIETQKLFVQLAGTASDLDAESFAATCRITTGTPPSNLRASVGGRPPFWTHPGVLSEEAEIIGLEAELNALAPDAPGQVALSIATDTPGVLTVSVDDVAVSETATASWAGKPSTSVELAALAPTVVACPFPTLAAGSVQAVEVELSGTFPRWRAYTIGTDDVPGRLSMKVDARFAVARCLPVDAATTMYGVQLLVGPSAGALHLELVADLAAAHPLAVADTDVSATEPTWIDVMFSSAIGVAAGTLWLVARAKTGTIEWIGTTVPDESAGPETLALVSSEGGRWDRYPALGAVTPTTQVRVLRLPETTDRMPLLVLSWPDGEGDPVGVNVDDDTTTVTLSRTTPLDAAAVGIVATAASSGTVTIKQATAVS